MAPLPGLEELGLGEDCEARHDDPSLRADDVIPFEDSAGFISMSGLAETSLIEVGTDHRLAEPGPLKALARAVEVEQDHSG